MVLQQGALLSSAMLPHLVRALSTSSAAAAAAPALATKPSSSGGSLLSSLGFGSARVDTPLDQPLATSTPPLRSSVPAAPPKLQSGALATGTKVVAVDTAGPISSLSLVVPAGSAHEPAAAAGASRVLEQLAFKASLNRTTFRITRELEKLGAVATTAVGRDFFALTVSAPKLHTPEATEILLDAALNQKLNYWEVQEAVAAAKAKLAAALKDPAVVLADVLHRAAFDGGLGLPLHPDPSALDHVTKEALAEYVAAAFAPGSAVLAAAGVGLDEFSELAGPLVSASAAAAGGGAAGGSASGGSSYVGGALNVLAPAVPLVYVGLAFEAKGGLADAKGAAAAAVAQALLGGPTAALPHGGEGADGVSSFASLYQSTGLVGLVASAPAAKVSGRSCVAWTKLFVEGGRARCERGLPGLGGWRMQVGAAVDAASKKLEAVAKGVTEPALKAAKQVLGGAQPPWGAAGLAQMPWI